IPMSDGAGIIEAVGPGVAGFSTGEQVIGCFFPNWQDGGPQPHKMIGVPGDNVNGFAAEYVTMPATGFTRTPSSYTFAQSSTLACAALTAWRGLMVEAGIKPGDIVLTQGSGGVSIFALQFAKAAGCRVISTSSSDAKLERLKELGADELINYKQFPKWGNRVLELTGGRGADVIVEIGGPGTLPQSIRAVRMGGHISMIGVLTGISGVVPTAALFQKNAVINGITVGSRSHQEDMIAAIEANGIEPVIDKSFPLAEIADAFRYQESQQHFGKICLEI
ncbi:MAG: NAD(P)-dependent alcohol dehydrogenase, partial [Deltaproteobacteria bacterium]|nr:NAD(P)-dependent alcohol dehydrogenase [Deltaproteobacteria bacterium]